MKDSLLLELYDETDLESLCIQPLVRRADDAEVEHDPVPITEVLNDPQAVIVGEPGSGKTTALRLLALELLRRNPRDVVPVYVSVISFDRWYRKKPGRSLYGYLGQTVTRLGYRLEDLSAAASGRVCLLLLDGWDDLGTTRARYALMRDLEDWQRSGNHCIITAIASRPRGLLSFSHYSMVPLSPKRTRAFVRQRVKDAARAHRLLAWISKTRPLPEAARNPLNLSMMTIVFGKRWRPVRLTRTRLYRRAFEVILGKHYKAHDYRSLLTWKGKNQALLLQRILARLAYDTMATGQGNSFARTDILSAVKEVLGDTDERIARLLTGRLAVVRDCGGGEFAFFHPWFQEFLAAWHLFKSLENLPRELRNERLAGCLPYVVGLQPTHKRALRVMRMVKDVRSPTAYARAISESRFSRPARLQLLRHALRCLDNASPRKPVRAELAQALAEAGPAAVAPLYSIVEDEAGEASDFVRRAALEALALLVPKSCRFRALLRRLLQRASGGVLWHALEHIGDRGDASAKEQLQLRRYAAGGEGIDAIARANAVWALRRIREGEKPPVSPDLVNSLLSCLFSEDDHVQGHALRIIGRLQVEQALPKLRRRLGQLNAPYRYLIPEAAAAIGGDRALDILRKALRDRQVLVVAAALRGVSTIRDPAPKDIETLVSSLATDHRRVRSLDETVGAIARATLARLRARKQ